jgi:hypothetical protein
MGGSIPKELTPRSTASCIAVTPLYLPRLRGPSMAKQVERRTSLLKCRGAISLLS